MGNKLRFAAVFVAFVGFVWVMMWGVGQSNREHLAKINQQLDELNSMSPEQYYNKVREDLLKQKKLKDELAKGYEKGTWHVIYVSTVHGAPVLMKILMKKLYE